MLPGVASHARGSVRTIFRNSHALDPGAVYSTPQGYEQLLRIAENAQ